MFEHTLYFNLNFALYQGFWNLEHHQLQICDVLVLYQIFLTGCRLAKTLVLMVHGNPYPRNYANLPCYRHYGQAI